MGAENHEEKTSSGAGVAVTFLLIGLGAGALVGLLLAPKTGKRIRKDLYRRFRDARSAFDDWKDEARDFAEDAMERGSDVADEIRERVAPLAKNLRRR
jgi:gas vesicle protein